MKIRVKHEEAYHACTKLDEKPLRFIVVLTADGWSAGVIDITSQDWHQLGVWADLEDAKLWAQAHARKMLRSPHESLTWCPGLPADPPGEG